MTATFGGGHQGARMLRAAVWTGGLFAAGTGVVHFFPHSWTEPLVLVVLGISLLALGRRGGRGRGEIAPQPRAVAELDAAGRAAR